jgi:hypothetical protein
LNYKIWSRMSTIAEELNPYDAFTADHVGAPLLPHSSPHLRTNRHQVPAVHRNHTLPRFIGWQKSAGGECQHPCIRAKLTDDPAGDV